MKIARALFAALLVAGAARGQETPAGVTESQLTVYRIGLETGCRDAGRRAGEPQPKADGFCNCMMDILGRSMSHAEWQRAAFHSARKQGREEMLVLDPHMSKTEICRYRY